MLKTEFEDRYGKAVTTEEYSFIERTYMAAEGVDKDRFCKEWKKYHLSESHIVAELTHAVEHEQVSRQQWQHTAEQEREAKEQAKRDHEAAIETNRQLAEERDELKAEVEKLALALLRNFREKDVAEILGRDEMIALKCANDIYLSDEDKTYLATRLKRR